VRRKWREIGLIACRSAIVKMSREVMLAGALGVFLALVPGAAFAQHSGGGAHGGGGGGHFGGGSAPAPARSSSAPSTSHAAAKSNAPTATAGKTTTENNSSTESATSTTTATGAARGWSATSGDARTTSMTPYTTNSTVVHTNGAVAAARPFNPNRPVYPYYPYYYSPYYGYYGYGYGGAFGLCDPFWGCSGFGFGYGAGFGLGFGYGGGYGYPLFGTSGSVSSGTGANDGAPGWSYSTPSPDGTNTVNANGGANGDGTASGTTEGDSSGTVSTDGRQVNPDVSANGPTVMLNGPAAEPQAPAEKTSATLYLTDGSSLVASDYWLTDGKLHYVTASGAENTVNAGQLDLQRTVDENAKLGITFSLKPGPTAAPQQ